MRVILFRGRATRDYTEHYIKKGDRLFGNLIIEKSQHANGYYIKEIESPFRTSEVDPRTVGQHTGRWDKNNVKIFEGDICKYRYGASTYIGKVVFNTRACIFEMRRTEIVGFHGERGTKAQLLNHIDKVEVIGNIYDNPDLLEVVEGRET